MNKFSFIQRILISGAIIFLAAGVWLLFGRHEAEREPVTNLSMAAQPVATGGFERAAGPREFDFPDDHGPHPAFQTEWWYYTGNLETVDGRHFGYQLTFFRRALTPLEIENGEGSEWRTNQVYLAHFAISDIEKKDFYYQERLAREGAGLAGAQGSGGLKVWLEDWMVEQVAEDRYRMKASTDDLEIELELVDLKGVVLQGDHGYSQKGGQPGNASYYFSQTRLKTSGKLRVASKYYAVEGFSWMDHEFSTSALGDGQVGWDWFSIQLDDGSELMLFSLRNADPDIDPDLAGTVIDADGSTHSLSAGEFELSVLDTWRSPANQAEYPAKWRIRIPTEGIEITVTPLMANQELHTFFTYWEGAVEISGVRDGKEVSGYGYVELTGYAQSMQGEF